MKSYLAVVLFVASPLTSCFIASAQIEGPVSTQALVTVDAKSAPPVDAATLTVSVNDHKGPLTGWGQVAPGDAQVALLIDAGLRQSVGREIDNLRQFVRALPPGIEVLVGYMQYGHVAAEQTFTANHEQAASGIRLPEGIPGMSASPYLCISDFVKKWPESSASSPIEATGPSPRKARFILMLSSGVDPYNGSTSITNQDSPYVEAAVKDAQRSGVAVYAIYYGDAGIRGGSANLSGQNYLSQLTEATGGVSYYQGTGNPVSMDPFLKMFQHSLAETYIASFNAPASKNSERDLVRFKISAPHTKLHAPEQIRVGNRE